MSIHKFAVLGTAAALAFGLSACGGDPTESDSDGDTGTITVGSAGFAESEIIAEIYAQALEAEGITVEKKLQIGAREAYIPALENGEIDLIPEYTGNLLTYFDPKATATAPEEVEDALEDALPEKLEILDVSAAEDKDSLNVTAQFADANSVDSIDDLAAIDGLKIAANPEFAERAYGIPGLKKVYGIDATLTPINDFGGPATLKALLDGKVDVADIYSTTPSITENKLVTLADPKNLIAAQNVVPLISEAKASDKVEDVLDAVSAKLTTEVLLELNGRNSGDEKAAPATIAKEWLKSVGLL